jgi:hypothetical protein
VVNNKRHSTTGLITAFLPSPTWPMGHHEGLPGDHQLAQYTLETIERTAMRIAALPVEAREDALDTAHQAYASAMHTFGQDHLAAAKWVEMVMTSVRKLVAQIDNSSRGEGGPA